MSVYFARRTRGTKRKWQTTLRVIINRKSAKVYRTAKRWMERRLKENNDASLRTPSMQRGKEASGAKRALGPPKAEGKEQALVGREQSAGAER
ncbi:hypothetical protein AAVH_22320 [Aphelenchoides avenae]|nr:hypothetical protein AAVH_24118 [Aphelenchus avenae]KAH7710389.1 hypothetical protein AAVH_22319 [Aphelenchus avenae]KAH7710390.1 hypothetical protein AAVH_22320 [Aphelenchus avenae]